MKNPYLRLRELTGLNQRDFERASNLSHTVVVSLEAGMFPSISEAQLSALRDQFHKKGIPWEKTLQTEFGTTDFDVVYDVWRVRERRAAAPHLTVVDIDWSKDESPFQQYINGTVRTRYAFCLLMKVPQATVMRYANGTTLTMPAVIRDAFLDAGKTPVWCQRLEEAQHRWHARTYHGLVSD